MYSSSVKTTFTAITLCALLLLFSVEGAFSQYYFGRNKVQYAQFTWHVLQTEHFDIYYYPEMRQITEIGAAYAEETYKILENKFNHTVGRKIPLIFYASHAHFQQTNTIPYLLPEGVGGFFEFLKGRVVVPSNGSISDFYHVIRHELIHVFTHSKVNRNFKNRGKLSAHELPLWFTEGLAEYWSEGWDSEAEMFIRDGVLNGYLVPLSEMYRIYGSFLMYKEGQAIIKYIAENYGEEKILQLIENMWKNQDFSQVMKLTLGVDYEEFDKEWLYSLKKNKYPLMETQDSAEMIAAKVTEDGINTKSTFYRKNGRNYTLYVSNRMGYSNIYLQELVDGEKLARAKPIIKGERTSEFEVFHILDSKIDVNDRGELTFVTKSGAHDVLYVYDLDEGTMKYDLHFDQLVSLYSPSWSPHGDEIVFSGITFGGQYDLYKVKLRTGELDKLTNDLYDDRDPAWSPDGNAIAFSSDRTFYGVDGYYNIFILNLNDMQIRYATCTAKNDFSPSWSPDGTYLSFTSDRDGALNIWMVKDVSDELPALDSDTATSFPYSLNAGEATPEPGFDFPSAVDINDDLRQLTHFTTGAFDPCWTEHGDILFTAFENFSFQIKQLDGILDRFATSERTSADSLVYEYAPWTSRELSGEQKMKSIEYKAKFDLDVAQSQITQDPIFGTSGGAQLAVSDMLGNTQYYFLLYNNARTKDEFLESFNVAVTRLDLSRRTNFVTGLYHFAGRYYNLYDFFFWERRVGGFIGVNYPFSVFRRLEISLNVRYSDKDWYDSRPRRKATLVSNFVTYIADNSLWGGTGPVDGSRLNITLGNTIDVQHANVNFHTIIFDYRKYFRLSKQITFATRLMTMYNEGKEATPFFMGGSWDLRGYRLWRIWGTKIGLVSNELRFPFIDRFMLRFPFGGIGLTSIRGAAFIDVGNGWEDSLDSILGSMGVGARWQIGGFLVLRLDFGRKFVIPDARKFYNFSRIEVENDWFTQFFFGWDF